MPQFTEQQTFDMVVSHLRKQGKKATTGKGGATGCRYRIEIDGVMCKCAAGCLIPDEEYKPEMEGVSIPANESDADMYDYDASKEDAKKASKLLFNFFNGKHNLNLVSQLQYIHDCNQVEFWESKFRMIAKSFNLVLTET